MSEALWTLAKLTAIALPFVILFWWLGLRLIDWLFREDAGDAP